MPGGRLPRSGLAPWAISPACSNWRTSSPAWLPTCRLKSPSQRRGSRPNWTSTGRKLSQRCSPIPLRAKVTGLHAPSPCRSELVGASSVGLSVASGRWPRCLVVGSITSPIGRQTGEADQPCWAFGSDSGVKVGGVVPTWLLAEKEQALQTFAACRALSNGAGRLDGVWILEPCAVILAKLASDCLGLLRGVILGLAYLLLFCWKWHGFT